MIRAALDRTLMLVGMAAYCCGLRRFVMWINRGMPRVLLYHAVEPEEDAFIAGLQANTTPAVFALHMAYLKRHYNVVSLATLEAGQAPPYAAVITFDDGYRSVLEQAYPILRAYDLPATVYLVSRATGTEACVWVNELNYYLRTHSDVARPLAAQAFGMAADDPPAAFVEHARIHYERDVIAMLLAELRAALPEAVPRGRYLTWDEARDMRQHGITFGNHTASHPNLACESPEAQRAEFLEARATIAEHVEAPTSLAYPFGTHDSHSADIALDTGHRSVMEVGGANLPLDLRRVGRTPVSATTTMGLFAELEVAAPLRGWIKRRFFGR